VERQAELMRAKLARRSQRYPGRGGVDHWNLVPDYLDELLQHLDREVAELKESVENVRVLERKGELPPPELLTMVQDESADVCNLAMMVRERVEHGVRTMAVHCE